MGVQIQNQNVIAVTLGQGMGGDGQAVERAKAVALIPFGVMKTAGETARHTVLPGGFPSGDHTATGAQGHGQDTGVPGDAGGLRDRGGLACFQGLQIDLGMNAPGILPGGGWGGEQADAGNRLPGQRLRHPSRLASGIEAVLRQDESVAVIECVGRHRVQQ